jgi:structural maintenance of chromosome 4
MVAGNLGAIDSKYDTAITTACGALDNFLVQSAEGGQMCLDYLRKIGGRARFIVLDEQQHFAAAMEGRSEWPAGTQRLFDLVQTEDKFKPAFYFALRDTLVASTLDDANVAAFGPGKSGKAQHRVVTLNGEIIDTSGTMSGGGKPRKGGMGSVVASVDAASLGVTEADVKAALAQVDTASSYSAEARQHREAIAAEVLSA